MSFLKLAAQLTLDSKGFQAGVRGAEREAGMLAKRLAGAFTVTAIVAASKQVVNYGSKIKDLSNRLEVSTTALQRFEYAANQSGASIEDVAAAFRALSKARGDALGGDTIKAGIFEALGLSKADLAAKSLEASFTTIASTIKSTNFGAAELDMITEVLGRSAQTLLPAFKAGLKEAGDEAANMGAIIEDATINALKQADDSMTRFAAKIRGTFGPAVAWAAERLRDMADGIDIAVGGFGAFLGAASAKPGALLPDFTAGQRAFLAHRDQVMASRERDAAGAAGGAERALGIAPDMTRAGKAAKEITEAEKILKLRTEILEIQRKASFEALDDGEKLKRLQTEIADLEHKRFEEAKGNFFRDNLALAELDKQIAEKQAEVQGLLKQQPLTALSGSPESVHGGLTPAAASRLARFEAIGSAAIAFNDIPRRQLSVSQEQLTQLRRIAERRALEFSIFGQG